VVAALGWLLLAFAGFSLLHGCCSVWVCCRTRASSLPFLGRSCCYIHQNREIRLFASAVIPVALASLKGDHFAKKPQIDKTIVIATEKGASHYQCRKHQEFYFIVDVAITTTKDDGPNLDVCLQLRQQTFNHGVCGDPCLPNRIKGACEHQYSLLHKAGWIPSEDAGKDGKTGQHLNARKAFSLLAS
jgi:hypothetical protein